MACFRIYCGYNTYHKAATFVGFVMQVSVRELKNHLSEYLHRVEEGENIQVERRHVPVARLVPISCSGLTRMAGTVWNGKQAQGGRFRPTIIGKSVAERVLEDRG